MLRETPAHLIERFAYVMIARKGSVAGIIRCKKFFHIQLVENPLGADAFLSIKSKYANTSGSGIQFDFMRVDGLFEILVVDTAVGTNINGRATFRLRQTIGEYVR